MKAGSFGLLAVGLVVGVGIGPFIPEAALHVVQSAFPECHTAYVTTRSSPAAKFSASMTQVKCESWHEDFYKYKLRISPKDGSWFMPIDLLSNGDGALFPTLYWTSEDALTVVSQGDEKFGSFVEHLDVGDSRDPRSINLTTVFEHASPIERATRKDLGAALRQP